MILLDSNTLIYLSKGLIKLSDLPNDGKGYSVSIITYMEVMGYSFENKQEQSLIAALFNCFDVLMLDKSIANVVIELRQTHKIKLPDAIICATAMHYDATLVSNDNRLSKINNLNVYQVG